MIKCKLIDSYPCESQSRKGHLNFKLNSKTVVPVLSALDSSPIFPFHLLPFTVHPTGFSFPVCSAIFS